MYFLKIEICQKIIYRNNKTSTHVKLDRKCKHTINNYMYKNLYLIKCVLKFFIYYKYVVNMYS